MKTPKHHIIPISAPSLLIAAALLACSTQTSFAGLTLSGLGVSNAHVKAISDDGTAVVGNQAFAGNGFRWTQGSGAISLGMTASAISGDGSAVAGDVFRGVVSGSEAARWTSAGGVQLLGQNGGYYSTGIGLSTNGTQVFGFSDAGSGVRSLFSWSSATGQVNLGPSPFLDVTGVSANGTIFAGRDSNGPSFRLTLGGTAMPLSPVAGDTHAYEHRISSDGTIVGDSYGNGLSHSVAWFGNSTSGTDLGVAGYDSAAYGASTGGAVIFGSAYNASGLGGRSYVWDAVHGARDLISVLEANGLSLTGWDLNVAEAISADGRAIVGKGTHLGQDELWKVQSMASFDQLSGGVAAFADGGDLPPIPEPATAATGALLIGVALANRRRSMRGPSPFPATGNTGSGTLHRSRVSIPKAK